MGTDLFEAAATVVTHTHLQALHACIPKYALKAFVDAGAVARLRLRARSDGHTHESKLIRGDLLGFLVVQSPLGIE